MNASPDSVGCFSTFFKEPPVDKQIAPGGKSENPTRNGRLTARNPSGWPRPVRQFRFPAGSGQIDPSRTRSCHFWPFFKEPPVDKQFGKIPAGISGGIFGPESLAGNFGPEISVRNFGRKTVCLSTPRWCAGNHATHSCGAGFNHQFVAATTGTFKSYRRRQHGEFH